MMRGTKAMAVVLIMFLLVACGSGNSETVLVMAAASLTDAFDEIEVAFEEANPSIDVQLNLAGSTALREQIREGAPADVFASANVDTMRQVGATGAVTTWSDFATNTLVIAVPAGNPGNVQSIVDLAKPDLLVGLCSDGVPCGTFARLALAQAGVEASVDTNEGDVRALLTKLEASELDVGLVYLSDTAANAAVELTIVYPIAALETAPNAASADAFVAFVLSAEGQRILASNAFGEPPGVGASDD